jgi:hypothetical protein
VTRSHLATLGYASSDLVASSSWRRAPIWRRQAGGAGGGQGGGAHVNAGGSLGAAGSSDFAPPPAPYLALTGAYAPTEAHWESHLNPRGGLRAQLARMKEELEAAVRAPTSTDRVCSSLMTSDDLLRPLMAFDAL